MEREFIKTTESIYKIGRTTQNPPWKRFCQYPNNSHLILMINVKNSKSVENYIKKQLMITKAIKHRKDIGSEYFEGDLDIIKKVFMANCFENQLLNHMQEILAPISISTPVPVLTPVPISTPVSVLTPVPISTPVPVSTPVPISTPVPVSTPVPTRAPIYVSMHKSQNLIDNHNLKNSMQSKISIAANTNICPFCSRRYRDKKRLQFHVIRCGGLEIKPTHVCQFCSQNFSKKFNLDRHLLQNR